MRKEKQAAALLKDIVSGHWHFKLQSSRILKENKGIYLGSYNLRLYCTSSYLAIHCCTTFAVHFCSFSLVIKVKLFSYKNSPIYEANRVQRD